MAGLGGIGALAFATRTNEPLHRSGKRYIYAMSVYLERAERRDLEPRLTVVKDALFADQRFDAKTLSGARFFQCTFANVSFKDARLFNCQFSGCVFEGCYFRETQLTECYFPASRFVSCEFPKVRIFSCGFGKARFQRSAPEFARIEGSLPGEHNLCRDVCQNIAVEASILGQEREARRYRLRAIEEHEKALRNGYRWSDDYSRSHYPTDLERLKAFLELCLSKISGWLWGHGEYISRLLASLATLAFLVGPVLLYLARSHLHGGNSASDCIALSVASVLNDSGSSGISTSGVALWISLALSASGLLFLGLFVTYLFRAVTRK